MKASRFWRVSRFWWQYTAGMVLLTAGLVTAGRAAAEIVFVDQGQARAVVVIADNPNPIAVLAAEELVEHVNLAANVTLEIVTESEIPAEQTTGRVFIGDTAAAARIGLEPAALAPDAFILRSVAGDLYIAGVEDQDEYHPRSGCNGTLYGVYEVLERGLGVRWLWPGRLGTYVPRTRTVTVPELDETVLPALRFRRYRTSRVNRALEDYAPADQRLAFSREGLENYGRDLALFNRRQRLGDSEPKPLVGHYFSGWWREHGETHPEWFMMREDGERGPPPGASEWVVEHVAMCVSNPDLHRYIVEEVWDGGPIIRLGEVDVRAFCQCPDCLAWDSPQPDEPPSVAAPIYRPQVVSDRYARFWRTILELAAERNPDVIVTTFLYWNYLPAPVEETTLDPRIYGEFVPWGAPESTWYPMSEAGDRWLREQWLGWQEAGVTMAYRPNHTLAGYAMPHLNTRQAGEFFQFAYENGMIGVDFDSLIGQWAVRGPEHYMYYRLFIEPRTPIDDIRAAYFSAFGPAAETVERYFDYWEEHNRNLQAAGSWRNIYSHPGWAPAMYPAAVFKPARSLLLEALAVAEEASEPEYAARVRFLQAGLEHARLSAAFIESIALGLPERGSRAFLDAETRLRELIAFRRSHEHLYIADYLHLAGLLENNRYRETIDALLE